MLGYQVRRRCPAQVVGTAPVVCEVVRYDSVGCRHSGSGVALVPDPGGMKTQWYGGGYFQAR